MSNDLISRSALLAAYDKAHQGPPGGARKLIEDAPEALVRCRDCHHWRPEMFNIKGSFFPCECERNGLGWDENDYCSYAERRR